MDLTNLFRACVKTVRLRYKTTHDKNRILKSKIRDDFFLKANEVKYQVTQLKDLLVENRAAYMRFGYHLKTATQMTDEERDIIDMESEKIITICNQYINDMKRNILKKKDEKTQEQLVQHELSILDILSNFLAIVYQMHNEQRKNRTQHEMETLKLLKLESKELMGQNSVCVRNNAYFDKSSNDKIGFEGKFVIDDKNNCNERKRAPTNKNGGSRKIAMDEDQETEFASENDISKSDDIQLFESENLQLLGEVKGLTDEVEQIEKNVVGIAKLQEIFTEKVNLTSISLYSTSYFSSTGLGYNTKI